MNKINIVIYDKDLDYVEALVELLNKYYYKYIKVIGITNSKDLKKLQSTAYKIDILIINESLIKESEATRYVKTVISLSETENTNDLEARRLYKYQNGQAIYNAISKIYTTVNKNAILGQDNYTTKVITFFSPIGGIGTSTISVALASKLTKEGKKVICINMEQISSMGVFFDVRKNQKNLSDLLYSSDSEDKLNEELLGEVINKDQNNIYYINPVNSILDFEELNGQEIVNIIKAIKEKLDFDYIIIDLGSKIDNLSNVVLENSDKAMLLIGQGNIAILKAEETLKQFDRLDNINLLVNKFDRELGLITSEEFIKMRKPIYFTINYDGDLRTTNMNINFLNNDDNFFSNITEFSNKLLREEW